MAEAAETIGAYVARGRDAYNQDPAIRDAILYQVNRARRSREGRSHCRSVARERTAPSGVVADRPDEGQGHTSLLGYRSRNRGPPQRSQCPSSSEPWRARSPGWSEGRLRAASAATSAGIASPSRRGRGPGCADRRATGDSAPGLDERCELPSDDRQPASLSAGDGPGGSRSCTAWMSVPASASTSANVIVISPCRPGSAVSNSTTSTTFSSGTSSMKRPWYVSMCAVILPAPVGWS
jgi:hypothetical protein